MLRAFVLCCGVSDFEREQLTARRHLRAGIEANGLDDPVSLCVDLMLHFHRFKNGNTTSGLDDDPDLHGQ